MTRRLTPKPHMLKSVRSRNWSLSGAIEELVDNSIGHGHATEITIFVGNNQGIAVEDDGIGVDDINRIFTYGDASAYDDLHQIGQYGVGATNATVYLGDVTEVITVRNKIKNRMRVDWAQVERSGEWPEAYTGRGAYVKEPSGTQVLVTKLARHYQLASSEKMVRDFGQVFAPALRKGTKITIHHHLAGNYPAGHKNKESFVVEPFTPVDLTDVIKIKGKVLTASGPLLWKGRAGLSESLPERFNGVHIAFGHRVIELTRDAFQGRSAPTLYVEVQLDDWTPWKHQLSEHKDRVVRYRDELIESIHEEIKALLDKAEQQAQSLALDVMTAPIEAAITAAMKGAGLLHIELDALPIPAGGIGEGEGPVNPGPGDKHEVFDLGHEGEPAVKAPRATGVRVEWSDALEGRAFGWRLDGPSFTVILDRKLFAPVTGWPAKLRDHHVIHMIIGMLSHALEMEYWGGRQDLRKVLAKDFAAQIERWAEERQADISLIAPHVYRRLIESARLPAKTGA